ncbi:hypothetical protein NFI96_027087, partial [Prochilodus magdalenae]
MPLRRKKRKTPRMAGRFTINHMFNTSDDIDTSESDSSDDLTQFHGKTLPVTCSAGRGVLHKSLFATEKYGKCIRTEDAWLSPQQFLKLNLRGGNWRRDITSHGKPLGILIMRRILEPHRANCKCPSCSEENLVDEKNDDVCFECNCGETELVCCDGCPRSFHRRCHNPPLQDITL